MIKFLSSELILHRPRLIYDKFYCLNIKIDNNTIEHRYLEFKYRSPFHYLDLKWYSLGWFGYFCQSFSIGYLEPLLRWTICHFPGEFERVGSTVPEQKMWSANARLQISRVFVRKWAKRHVSTSITPHRCQRYFASFHLKELCIAQYLIDPQSYFFIIFFSCTWDL